MNSFQGERNENIEEGAQNIHSSVQILNLFTIYPKNKCYPDFCTNDLINIYTSKLWYDFIVVE